MGGPSVVSGPQWLSATLSAGGVPRSAVTMVADCPAAHVDMLAAVTREGGCVAVVGYPSLALAAVEAAGGDLERMVVVPDPEPHALAVVGTLVEGLDMVLFAPSAPIAPACARPVEARLRKSKCALLVTGYTWPRARLTIDVSMTGVVGLGYGLGRIRGVSIAGRVWGNAQPPCAFHAVLGQKSVCRTADDRKTSPAMPGSFMGPFMSDATCDLLREVAQ
ncbi:hypothetical protein GSS87_07175 [Corynebacterium sp. 4HC-13]|uniref:hypothetical protein n=1 Tax=Corynebacterium anserum TaxID=2684406 RepID=UPI00163B370F|nr:hypothetical protein [Corynebacterium anserum]MBC2682177.1 hypothetical protein [Corynebacterium anserum]